ncbi:MAG: succinate dehydrogenase, cytochrome b556 subunit [Rickettsiales bacterium]|nr:succinate dehydrogenase, cytochrome b556 subunit [Rickettsiales bacterium]
MANKKDSRPTSPHLQIYAWNISSFTSILHRLTGVLLYFSIIAISWYVVFYAYQVNVDGSSEQCDCPLKQVLEYVFYTAIIGVVFALYYHLCNGIRHLFWDIGKGYDLRVARFTAFLAILMAVIFTGLTIGFAAYFKFM